MPVPQTGQRAPARDKSLMCPPGLPPAPLARMEPLSGLPPCAIHLASALGPSRSRPHPPAWSLLTRDGKP
eukprot:9944037-Lingulodinium_polyedra.AAC.1